MAWITPVLWPVPAPVGNGDFDRIEGNIDYIRNQTATFIGVKTFEDSIYTGETKEIGWYFSGSTGSALHTLVGGGSNPLKYKVSYTGTTSVEAHQFLGNGATPLMTIYNGDGIDTIGNVTLEIQKNLGWFFAGTAGAKLHNISGGGANPLKYTTAYSGSAATRIHEFYGNGANPALSIFNNGELAIDDKLSWVFDTDPNVRLHSIEGGGANPIMYKTEYSGTSTILVHSFYGSGTDSLLSVVNNGEINIGNKLKWRNAPGAEIYLHSIEGGLSTAMKYVAAFTGTATTAIHSFYGNGVSPVVNILNDGSIGMNGSLTVANSIDVSGNINPTTTPTLSTFSLTTTAQLIPRGIYSIQNITGTTEYSIVEMQLSTGVWAIVSRGITSSTGTNADVIFSDGINFRIKMSTGTATVNYRKF